MIVCAIVTSVLGAIEYFRQHRALKDVTVFARGTVVSTVPNMLLMTAIWVLVCGGLFIVILVVA